MVSGRLAARMVHAAIMEEQVNWAIDADIRDFHSRALLASAYCRWNRPARTEHRGARRMIVTESGKCRRWVVKN